jgi:hypothetical protein
MTFEDYFFAAVLALISTLTRDRAARKFAL